ncbi:hypothetical protein SKB0123_01150 [Staphylococcus capitis]|nr:hypothetical protein GCM10008141_15350 [Staphylococcus capitis]
MKKILILITALSLFLGACNTDNFTEHKKTKQKLLLKKIKTTKHPTKKLHQKILILISKLKIKWRIYQKR